MTGAVDNPAALNANPSLTMATSTSGPNMNTIWIGQKSNCIGDLLFYSYNLSNENVPGIVVTLSTWLHGSYKSLKTRMIILMRMYMMYIGKPP